MRMLRILGLVFFCIAAPSFVHAQTKHFTAPEAKNHVGEKVTVCGKVVSTHFAGRSRGQPTFLNLDEPYPNQIFTIVIWGSDRPKFGDPEAKYRDKDVCVTGKITSYQGVPEIAANDPSQIEIHR
jgi:micrococcal nuclease